MPKVGLSMGCWTWKEYNLDLIPLTNMSYLWNERCVLQMWKVGSQNMQKIGDVDLPLTYFGSVSQAKNSTMRILEVSFYSKGLDELAEPFNTKWVRPDR